MILEDYGFSRRQASVASVQDIASDLHGASPETNMDKCSVRTINNLDALEALRPLWKIWGNSLETDFDYFLHQLRDDSETLMPYVITIYKEGVARAMLAGQIRKRRATTVISFMTIHGPTMRVLEIKKGGRMGQESPEIDRILARELHQAAENGTIDSICFERLPLQSELFHQISVLPGFFLKERVPHVFYYSELSFVESGANGAKLFSGKVTREMRRKKRILDRAFPGQAILKCFSQCDELETAMEEAMRVAGSSWQHSMGQGLDDNARMRDDLRFFAQRGWLRIYILYVKDEPCAFLIGQLYNQVFYCQYAGYHADYAHFSVGAVLESLVFEKLPTEGVQRVDLGEGGQEHNRRIGCRRVEEGTVHVYSPTLRGAWLNLFFGTTQFVRVGGRRIRSTLRLTRVGRVWRRYLLSTRRMQQASYTRSERRSA